MGLGLTALITSWIYSNNRMGFIKKIYRFISSPTHSRTIGILTMLVLVLAIFLTVKVAQQQQIIKQKAETICEVNYHGTCYACKNPAMCNAQSCPNGASFVDGVFCSGFEVCCVPQGNDIQTPQNQTPIIENYQPPAENYQPPAESYEPPQNAEITTFTYANFETQVIRSSQPIIVDFGFDGCHACNALSPYFDELAREYAGKIKFGKFDTKGSTPGTEIIGNTNWEGAPTIMLYRNGTITIALAGWDSRWTTTQPLKSAIAKFWPDLFNSTNDFTQPTTNEREYGLCTKNYGGVCTARPGACVNGVCRAGCNQGKHLLDPYPPNSVCGSPTEVCCISDSVVNTNNQSTATAENATTTPLNYSLATYDEIIACLRRQAAVSDPSCSSTDINHDGIVNALDYNAWLSGYAKTNRENQTLNPI